MKINVHGGHCSHSSGASGYLSELTEDRKVKNLVISKLEALGHTVYDCTDDVGANQSRNLRNIVAKCNAHKVDLDVSIHFNAGGGTGTEVWVYSAGSSAKSYAQRTVAAIAELGFRNRGVKYSKGLYVLKHTNSPAMLIECCFVDSQQDANRYNAEKMANAIVKGITGQTVAETPSYSSPTAGSNDGVTPVHYLVRIKASTLNVRRDHSASSAISTTVKKGDVYTIVGEYRNGSTLWGKLKSGAGWISLAYTTRV